MEKYILLVDQKTILLGRHLWIQYNSTQDPSQRFDRNWKVDSKIHMEVQSM